MKIDGNTHAISLDRYTLGDLRRLVELRTKLSLGSEVEAKIAEGAAFVARRAARDEHIYGTNTGFGSLCETRVESTEMELLQFNHVVSHAVGIGPDAPERISRLTMLIKLLTFRSGHTGISVPLVLRFLDLWNHDVIPAIPKKGTVGASGDLAPLAHMALPLLGLGRVHFEGQVVPSRGVLEAKGWQPVRLGPKEGLALTNGVQYINAFAADSVMEFSELIRAAEICAAMSVQGFSASRTFYQAAYQATSLHEERGVVAKNLRRLLEGSNHFDLPTCNRSKQDPYSFRCIPQVHAAVRQTFRFAQDVIEKECNSVSDNPLFFPASDEILFGGALHGESTAMSLDFMAIAVSELANISERRTWQLLSGKRGLPDFLVTKPGVNSGMMITQYTSAALVNENKVMATPASIDTITTCQTQEDHVSMGGTSAYKLQTVLENCSYVLGIELLNAAQAIDMNAGLRLSPMTASIQRSFREQVRALDGDRVLSDDMEQARSFIIANKRAWTNELGLD